MGFHFPFAALLDQLLSAAVPIAVFLIWLFNQISDAKKKRNTAGVPPVARPQEKPQQQPANGPQNDPLRAQIDEFLKRANQQAQQASGQPAAPAQRDDVVVLLDEAPAERRRDAQPPRLKPAAQAQQPQKQRREKQKRQRGKSVAEHVAGHVGAATEQMRAEVSNLGERVIAADRQFDAQMQQRFDHRLGTLGSESGTNAFNQPAAAAVPSAASQIAAMLSSPEGARQAIILNEILRRPEDRW